MYNYKNIILFFTSIFLIVINIYAFDTVSAKFMPLKIGNSWTYKRSGGFPPPVGTTYYYRCSVTRDTVIGSHIYYYLNRAEHFNPVNPNYNWFRIDSTDGKLICYSPGICGTSDFYTFDSLSASVNNIFKSCPSDSLYFRKLLLIIETNRWNTQTVEMDFNWTSGPAGYFRKYSKFFGLTYSGYGELNPIIYDMMGCVINGVLYGDTNTFTSLGTIFSEIPEKYMLFQNYPNPFNPATNIKFTISKSGFVKLTVFDILGKDVQQLLNNELNPGTYSADWDASDYPSGVYYYRLESENFTETKKMVLIK